MSDGTPTTLDGLVTQQCARTPDAVAVVCDDTSLTYAELDRRASAVAAALRARGAGPDTVVALCLPRSADLAVAVLAVVRAGAAYLPLALDDPAERQRLLVRDSGAVAVLADADTAAPAQPWGAPVLDIADCPEAPAAGPAGAAHEHNLAYVLYTSGSTGLPKGVLTEHAAIRNRLEWMQRALPIGPGDTVLQKTPYTFDVSVWEFFWPLITGARLAFARPGGHRDPRYLLRAIHEYSVTVLHFVPSMLEEFLHEVPHAHTATLRRVLVSGEELRLRTQQRFFERLPGVELHNLYGPTEAAIDVTHWRCDPGQTTGQVPIGHPVDGVSLYVVDPELRPVAPGGTGELCIGGVAVARGYLNRPEAERTAFVPDPFTGRPGTRMYRTGDLASVRPDGAFDYHGRIDHQIKLGGVRIEAGEVETALERLELIDQAVVGLRQDADGRPLLVAWTTGRLTAADAPAVRAALARTLPAAYVPSALVPVQEFPLSRHGKTDRKALPWPAPGSDTEPAAATGDGAEAYTGDGAGGSGAGAVTPDARLRRLWRDVLGSDPDTHGFFEAGGTSLLAVRLVSAARREFDVELDISDFLARAHYDALLDAVTKARASGACERDRIDPVSRDGRLPLSSSQLRMWLLQRADPDDIAMTIHGGLRLTGPADHITLVRVLHRLLDRHEVLRTSFPDFDGRPAPVIEDGVRLDVPRVDRRGLPEGRRAAAAVELTLQVGAEPFDAAHGPLVRAALVEFADDDHFLVLALHHIVTDGWSWSVIAEDFCALWAAETGADPAIPEPLAVQYADYAAWEARRAVPDAALDHWAGQLRDLPPLPRLAGAGQRPPALSLPAGTVEVTWADGFAERLAAFCARHATTAFSVLLAGYATLLGRLSQQEDLIVAAPLANRTDVDVEPLVGCFINTLPLRVRPDEDLTFLGLVRQVAATAAAAQTHGMVPVERMYRPLAGERVAPGLSPLLQALLVVQNTPPWRAERAGLRAEIAEVPSPRTHYALKLEVRSLQAPLPTRLVHALDVLDPQQAATFAAQLAGLLDQALADPDAYIHDYSLLSSTP
ncbi:non-ribosomal peptide synthetase [Streptomyces anandii]|uniref:non-ribosomal peptide synthetase n=1 Tax=Streptomyces anandii TaxID=285454 RepID=UPI0016765306|nr:non-ribosomal peptide synthetase [Streptomyces anandii]GGY05064.1 hypothetical protein GCM10010510_58860 [Streptomyces anandii JCM 4720]